MSGNKKSMKSRLNLRPEVLEALEDRQSEIRKSLDKLVESVKRLHDNAPIVEARIASLDPEIRQAIEKSSKNVFERRFAYIATILAQYGWFVSFHGTGLDLMSSAFSLFDRGKREEGNALFGDHIESLVPSIEASTRLNFSERDQILSEAFRAHEEGRYALSIPVFLSQADGIAAKFFKTSSVYSFGRIDGRVDDFISLNRKDIFESPFHHLVKSLMPINASGDNRKRYENPLNRHLVLHGESVDYPSKINSLKSISWLQFICSFNPNEQFPPGS